MKIVMIGGTGMLGKSIKKIRPDIICLGREFDIYDFATLEKRLNELKPDIIINAAAIKTNEVNENKSNSININIIGSANISKYCIDKKIKLIYISTDYVYPGIDGNYKETDKILPENLYAWTKLAGECSTKMVDNHIIIRTSFGTDIFPYEYAYDNLYTSKDYVDVISKMIVDALEIDYVGVLNIGTNRKSIFEYASKKNIVNKCSLFEKKDFSMNTELYDILITESKNKSYKKNNICPITNRSEKIKYFDLGDIPLVNNLTDTFEESINCERFPLSISLFKESGLSAIDIIVDPNKMFMNYLFRSDTNKPYYSHCKNMYKYLLDYIKLDERDLCVDVGGNDGTLLLAFNEISNQLNFPICEKLNIDPSKNITIISRNNNINTINDYFGEETYKKIDKKAKLIVSTNVFQHLHNIKDFVKGIYNLLDDNGIWCLEFPYWANNMETNQFDQVYHEHIYYYLVTPLYRFLKLNKLKIINISEHYIHGGSLRLIITKDNSDFKMDNTLDYYLTKEKKYDIDYYLNWSNKINDHLLECEKFLKSLNGNIVGFGAAAKGCVFLNRLKIDYKYIKYVIDDTILKQNKYIPGTGIKIINREIINREKIDYILILAHNFSEYIIDSLNQYGFKGKYVVLLPDIKIMKSNK